MSKKQMEFDTEHDKEKFVSLKGLINNHNGEWKSGKQGNFFKKTWSGNQETSVIDFLGYDFEQGDFVVYATSHINFAPSRGVNHKGYREFTFIFIADNYGVKSHYKISHSIERSEERTFSKPVKKSLVWEREELKYKNGIRSSKEKQESKKESREYVANIGDRIERKVELVYFDIFEKRAYHGGYEYVSLYKFEDEENNLYVWFTQTTNDWEKGDELAVRMTIKKHEKYRQEKQNVVSRVTKINEEGI